MKEIGGSFFLDWNTVPEMEEEKPLPVNGLKGHTRYYFSCRNAIQTILETEGRKGIALVPPFTCHAVLQPFLTKGLQVRPFPIGKDLKANPEKLLELAEELRPAYFLYHSWFGFTDPAYLPLTKELQEKGIIVIEDRTQNMFSEASFSKADYTVGSLRKWLEAPDGGYLTSDRNLLQEPETEFSQAVQLAMDAMEEKFQYLSQGIGTDAAYRQKFADYEELFDRNDTVFRMSNRTKYICSRYDWDRMKKARKANFDRLAEGLRGLSGTEAIFEKRDPGTVPFMLPVYIKKNRRELQRILAAQKIFATVIWGCPEELQPFIDETVREIYDEILCFAVDQRYTPQDMDRIAECLRIRNGKE